MVVPFGVPLKAMGNINESQQTQLDVARSNVENANLKM